MDEYGFGRAHVDVECERLGFRDYLARPAIFVHLSDGRDVSVSLRDSSGDDRNGRRPLTDVVTPIPIAVQADIGSPVARAIVNQSPLVRTIMMTPLLGRMP